jgi:hypothetical protein
MIAIPLWFLLRVISAQILRWYRETKPLHALRSRGPSGPDHVLRRQPHRARVSASQTPPPIMKPPETRDINRVRRAEKIVRMRPASSA